MPTYNHIIASFFRSKVIFTFKEFDVSYENFLLNNHTPISRNLGDSAWYHTLLETDST